MPGREPKNLKPAIHACFYRWAQPLVAGKRVLDAGCGDGAGSVILAETAAHVVGIDRDAECVSAARRSHGRQNLEYRQMDCQQPDLPSESFDVVVSNALFEYLDDFDGFMAQSTRLLVPGGLFLSGTKNLLLSLRRCDGAPLYRNHEQEFTPESLRSKLEEYYQDVEIYGEVMSARAKAYLMNDRALGLERVTVGLGIKHAIPLSWRKAVRRWLTGVQLAELTEEDFQIVAHSLDEAFYLVGRGRRA